MDTERWKRRREVEDNGGKKVFVVIQSLVVSLSRDLYIDTVSHVTVLSSHFSLTP